MLKLMDFSLWYDRRPLLENVNCEIRVGEHVALLGLNGSGKSTLMQVIANVPSEAKWSGKLLIGDGAANARERVIWIPQQAVPCQLPLRADEFVMLGRTSRLPRWGAPRPEDRAAVTEAMDLTGTGKFAAARLHQLSDGERQRLALALALASGADLLLLDEPTAHLDYLARQEIIDLIASLRGKTILIATHDLEWAKKMPRCLEIKDLGIRQTNRGETT